MADLEAQKDELEALQSIYTSEEFKVNAKGEEVGGQFFAHIDLPSKFTVVAKKTTCHRKGFENTVSPESTSYAESFSVDHLPPIVLYVTLPPNYPSEEKPKFLLSCKWLTRGKLSKICRHLDKLWEESKGMEILFVWTQFLKEEVLQFLKITNTLDVSTIYSKQISYLEKKRAKQQKSRLLKLQESEKNQTESRISPNIDEKNAVPEYALQVGASLKPQSSQQTTIPLVNAGMRPSSSSTRTGEASRHGPVVSLEHISRGRYQPGGFDRYNKFQKPSKQTMNMNYCGKKFSQEKTEIYKSGIEKNKESYTLNPEAPPFVQKSETKPFFNSPRTENIPGAQIRQNARYSKPVKETPNFDVDSRTVFDLPMTEPVCLALQLFDKQQQQVVFARTTQECTVCFTTKPGSECIKFDSCGHVFCIPCIRGYFEVQVRDGNVKSLKCLEDKCNTEATPAQVKAVLSPETFAKYDAALLAVTLDTLSDIVYCPRRACQYPVSIELEDSMGRCPSCQHVFCIYCRMTYHGIEPCKLKSEEQLKLVNEYNTGSEEARSLLERRYGRKQLQRLVDTVLSEQWVSTNSQNCPKCNVSIEKSSGCNKMTCWKCGCYFCWLCLTTLDPALPYLHFNRPNTSCFNRLFEGIDEDDDDDNDEDEDEDDDLFWQDAILDI